MLQAAGYPDTDGALSRVSRKLGVPHSTLRRWFHKLQNPPPSELVQEKKLDLVAAIKSEVASILEYMTDAREDADYRALGTVFGIMVDKLQLLEGKPTERTEHKVEVTDARERLAHLITQYASRAGAVADTERAN